MKDYNKINELTGYKYILTDFFYKFQGDYNRVKGTVALNEEEINAGNNLLKYIQTHISDIELELDELNNAE